MSLECDGVHLNYWNMEQIMRFHNENGVDLFSMCPIFVTVVRVEKKLGTRLQIAYNNKISPFTSW